MEPIVIVHGGAGNIPNERNEGKIRGTILATKVGYEKLLNHGSALDAVEAAIRTMELDEYFNAGYGSVLTLDGDVEMDASIMDGSNLKAGCVSIVKDIQHPISLARQVMEKTVHTFLVGEGLMEFARNIHVHILEPGALVTEYAREALEEFKENLHNNEMQFGKKEFVRHIGEVGTVGAVAMDREGNIAAATSTGGITGKLPGRVGDSPILGSGTYADNEFGGVSTSGHGETNMKFNLAHDIIKRIQFLNEDAQNATKNSLTDMFDKLLGTAGAITIDKNGEIGIYFTSQKFAWAYKKGNCIHYGINRDEHEINCE